MPDVQKPFEIKTDASAHALGAVLWQDDRVVAYHSEMFNTALLNFPHTRSRCPTATGCVCSMQHVEAVQQEVGALSAQYLPGHGKSITIDFVGRLPYLLKGGNNGVFVVVDLSDSVRWPFCTRSMRWPNSAFKM